MCDNAYLKPITTNILKYSAAVLYMWVAFLVHVHLRFMPIIPSLDLLISRVSNKFFKDSFDPT